MSLDPTLLEHFRVLATTGSISRAARQLHLSPSALSRQLARLEERLGLPLARRGTAGIELTDGGRCLLRHAEQWQQFESELLADLRGTPRDLAGFVRIAGYSSAVRSLLMPALAPLLRAHPGLQVHFLTLELSRVHTLLLDGHADIALSLAHCPRQGIHNHALGEERNVLVESALHRSRDEVYIDHEPSDNFTELFLHQRVGRVPARFRRSYAHDIYGLIDAVALGLGRAVLPRHLLHGCTGLRVVAELGELALPVVLHHPERALHARPTRAVLDALLAGIPPRLAAAADRASPHASFRDSLPRPTGAEQTMGYGVLGELKIPLVFGLLRLSTEGRPAQADAIGVIHAALDAGIRVLDSADSYALDDRDLHYGERLARAAVESWHGPREEVRIVTKAGMARPKGRWVPNARPDHLRRMVDGSLAALAVECLPLLLLHGNDPGTPFEDSLGTLAELQRAGKIAHLGLCNVDVPEILQAQRHFAVTVIQNELSVINRKAAAAGTLELARQIGAVFMAHRPLGGHAKTDTLEKNRAMAPIATRHGCSRHEAALATLLDAGPPLLPVVGATRIERIESWRRALSMRLDASDRAGLDGKISLRPDAEGEALLAPAPARDGLRALQPGAAPGTEPEVVIVMGVQGAGKSTVVQRYVDAGFERLNRDLAGGKLDDLVPLLDAHLAAGRSRIVLDNTYPTRVSRWPVIRAAQGHGVPVRCVHLATPVREALVNISLRLLERYGTLPGPDELKELGKSDPNLPPPMALARYAACFEAPHADEGFGAIDEIPFVRQPTGPLAGTVKALLLDVDGTLRRTRSGEIYPSDPEDIEILPGRREVLQRWVADGWQLFLVSNQSGIASGNVSEAAVRACFERTIALLGVPVTDLAFCPHTAFPAGCFCRKPMPGLGIALARKHGLAIDQWVMVGDMDSDADFARAIGARYVDAAEFFA